MKLLTIGLVPLILLVTACGSERDAGPSYPPRAVNEPEGGSGGVAGVIRFDGTAPPPRELPAPDASCRREGHVIRDESLVVADGKLRDVLVWIEKGAERWSFAYERSEALVDQRGCVFVPHVIAVRAFQPVRFRNSDPLLHNVNCSNSKGGFARNVTPREESFVRQFREPELGKRVTCDLHGNMLMYAHVLDHPWFAVTGADGAFEIDGLPPGRYTLAARHEKLGEKRREVEVKAGGLTAADFSFKLP